MTMKFNPDTHHRRSIRLRGYDYSRPSVYFVTLCVQHKECLFGEIAGGQMHLNAAGEMVLSVWDELPTHYPGICTDEFTMMPNHIHGIIAIDAVPPRRGEPPCSPNPQPTPQCVTNPGSPWYRAHTNTGATRTGQTRKTGQTRGSAPTATTGMSLSDVVQRFKTMTTTGYIRGVNRHDWAPFPGKLWQRNYWERIVRGESELDRIREYIHNNPMQWECDDLYPDEED